MVTAIEIEVPMKIKVFVPAETAKFFRLFAQVALHFSERFGRIDDRIAALPLHSLDLLEDLNQFLGAISDEARIAEAQIARSEGGQRIAEGAALESKFAQEIRKLFVIIDQFAGGDARGGLNAKLRKHFGCALDLSANSPQTATFLMLCHIVRIGGHDHASQAIGL